MHQWWPARCPLAGIATFMVFLIASNGWAGQQLMWLVRYECASFMSTVEVCQLICRAAVQATQLSYGLSHFPQRTGHSRLLDFCQNSSVVVLYSHVHTCTSFKHRHTEHSITYALVCGRCGMTCRETR